ncbi:MAG: hypothetical protein QM765_39750 [Myxococcales bacterium]
MRTRLLLLLTPLPAIAVGAAVAVKSGVSAVAFLPNAAAVVLGVIFAALLPKVVRGHALATAVVAVLAIATTLVFEGNEGVHRWLQLGPIRLNASAAFAPLVLAALAQRADWRSAIVAAAALAIQLVQPDAGQQTALAVGLAVLLIRSGARPAAKVAFGAILVSATAWAWIRPDPLAPVAHVERIHSMAIDSGLVGTLGMALALVVLVAPLLLAARRNALAGALGAYLVTTLLVPLFGAFPVPVLGAGAGPVLGWYLALGLSQRGQQAEYRSP